MFEFFVEISSDYVKKVSKVSSTISFFILSFYHRKLNILLAAALFTPVILFFLYYKIQSLLAKSLRRI